MQVKDRPVQPPQSLPHPDRTLYPVIFGLKHLQPVTKFSPVQIVPVHAGQGSASTVQPPQSLPHPDRTLFPVIFGLKHLQPVTRFSPVQIVPVHAGQGSASTVQPPQSLPHPRQDTLPCNLRTPTSSTSDQAFPCPNCSSPCRSRIGQYSHQKACHTQTGHSTL